MFLFTYCSGHVMQMISCRLFWLQPNCVTSHSNFPLSGVYLEIIVLFLFVSASFALAMGILCKTSHILQTLMAFL